MNREKEVKRERKQYTPPIELPRGEKLVVKIKPITWIIAPIVLKENLQRWHSAGWISEEELHLDRAFPRIGKEQCFIPKLWLKAVLTRAYYIIPDENIRKIPRSEAVSFDIVDEKGFPINYIVVDKPQKYRRSVRLETGEKTLEFIEFLDASYEIKFIALTMYPQQFIQLLDFGGKYVGMGARTKQGYGRFTVSLEVPKTQ